MSTLIEQAAAAWAELRQRRGMITNIAHGLGIQPQAVWQWQTVPLHRLYDVARIAGVSWKVLRPDVARCNVVVRKTLVKAARRQAASRNGDHRSPYTQALRTQSTRKRRHGKGPDKQKNKLALKTKRRVLSTVPRL
jgi:hypothetical protein